MLSDHADDLLGSFYTKNLPGRGSIAVSSSQPHAIDDIPSFRTAPLANDSLATSQNNISPHSSSPTSDVTSSGTYYTAPSFRLSSLDLAKFGFGSGPGTSRQRAVDVMPQVGEASDVSNKYLSKETEFRRLLASKSLIASTDQELNRSGRGQHAEFAEEDEVRLLNLGNIGTLLTARVDKVRCRRIVLVRKMMRCNTKWPLSRAIEEVNRLHRLRHPHIV